MIIEVKSPDRMIKIGKEIGQLLEGGEVIELVGDVGAGKTTLVKGIAKGLEINEVIQSPSFTISRVYDARDEMQLCHYDFYRLNDAGIMADELAESRDNNRRVTVIEWGDIVSGVLPKNRLTIRIYPTSENSRQLHINQHRITKELELIK